LGTIALDLKRRLVWDSEREEAIDDPEANKLLSYEYRAPWKLPGQFSEFSVKREITTETQGARRRQAFCEISTE
jgi:hypothetical protein